MISTILKGGLGNQLFIYATARALSLRLQTGLILNTHTGFDRDIAFRRSFELSYFPIKYSEDKLLSYDYRKGYIIQKIGSLIGRNFLAPSYKHIEEPAPFDKYTNILSKINSKNVFIDGYWQSEKYFNAYEKEIREDLHFSEKTQETMKSVVQGIFSESHNTPVCVGVRRYQECKDPSKIDKVEEDYYLEAMSVIERKVSNPIFYVFTQDKNWVNERLLNKGYEVKVVDYEISSTINDLYLMTKFRYHIISNSSFYWWGAWLAKGETVVSNKKFANKDSNCETWVVL